MASITVYSRAPAGISYAQVIDDGGEESGRHKTKMIK